VPSQIICIMPWISDVQCAHVLQRWCWIFSNISSLTTVHCYEWLKIHPKSSALLLEPNLG